MSRKGNSGDNARAEGFFGLLKCEFFHGRDWRGWGLGDFMAELDGWMSWYREGRASQAPGWLTPRRAQGRTGLPCLGVQENVRSPRALSVSLGNEVPSSRNAAKKTGHTLR